MLLTIKTRMSPATDLGHLLHKHPDRVQRFEQAFGTAHVFYPDAGERECTAALLLDVDPVKLVRTRGRGTPDRAAIGAAGLWDELDTGWLAVDGELMPWSAKAMELIRTQYAATGAAARAALPAASAVLARAGERGLDLGDLRERVDRRAANASRFRDAYARYCWTVEGLSGLRFAPFQILAGEGRTWATARDHDWHMAVAGRLADHDPAGFVRRTASMVADLESAESEAAVTEWWEGLTADGGEGMVVKPLGPPPEDRRVQPGVKCRGREYLRIVYGPDYTEPENLDRLRGRSLGRKRSLAMREHALGVEALDRLTGGEPLWRVHQAVFAVLALESEPVDPRL